MPSGPTLPSITPYLALAGGRLAYAGVETGSLLNHTHGGSPDAMAAEARRGAPAGCRR